MFYCVMFVIVDFNQYHKELLEISDEIYIERKMDLYKQMFYCVMFVIVVCSQYCKELLEISDLIDIERKMDLYKQMFYCVMFVIVVCSQYCKELLEISDSDRYREEDGSVQTNVLLCNVCYCCL